MPIFIYLLISRYKGHSIHKH